MVSPIEGGGDHHIHQISYIDEQMMNNSSPGRMERHDQVEDLAQVRVLDNIRGLLTDEERDRALEGLDDIESIEHNHQPIMDDLDHIEFDDDEPEPKRYMTEDIKGLEEEREELDDIHMFGGQLDLKDDNFSQSAISDIDGEIHEYKDDPSELDLDKQK